MATSRANFHFPSAYRIGAGRVSELGEACRELGLTKPLVVSDPGVVKLPWFESVRSSLRSAGVDFGVWSDVGPNPTGSHVADGLAKYRAGGHRGVVLVGGGSAMDAGKCIALLADNPGDVFDYEDVGDNWKRADPEKVAKMIAIPTTAGTGSEVGRCGVIADERDHSKKIIFHPRMQPSLVIADPELTRALPPGLTAATGMDALAHCFEAYCAPGYHPMADGIALEGMRIIDENLKKVFRDGSDLEARTQMMMAATMGATAFQKGLGLVHAWSHPLGGATGIHHGTANAIFLPYVMVHNRPVIEDKMKLLARYLGLAKPGFDGVLAWMRGFLTDLDLPSKLEGLPKMRRELGTELAALAEADPSLGSNPKPLTRAELVKVFEKTYDGDLTP